jgi:hypothetical protein
MIGSLPMLTSRRHSLAQDAEQVAALRKDSDADSPNRYSRTRTA